VYFAVESIRGKTFVSEAAAKTVGDVALAAAVLDWDELGAAGDDVASAEELLLDEEPLLPQAATTAASPATLALMHRRRRCR
jgi:hypothetical protein